MPRPEHQLRCMPEHQLQSVRGKKAYKLQLISTWCIDVGVFAWAHNKYSVIIGQEPLIHMNRFDSTIIICRRRSFWAHNLSVLSGLTGRVMYCLSSAFITSAYSGVQRKRTQWRVEAGGIRFLQGVQTCSGESPCCPAQLKHKCRRKQFLQRPCVTIWKCCSQNVTRKVEQLFY